MAGTTFAALQGRLHDLLRGGTPEGAARAMVVCPSLTFPVPELRKIVGIQHYEERLLFLSLLLRRPDLELLYPTSVPVDPAIVDYHLRWLPDPEDARRRLHLFSVEDASPAPLTVKLLQRPDVIAAMRDRLAHRDQTLLLPFIVTAAEAQLAEELGVPVYGPDPEHAWLGSKSGAREVALQAGVPVFDGEENLRSMAELEAAVHRLREARPDARAAVAKLNHGFSGQGNLMIELDGLRRPLESSAAVFCAAEESWPSYAAKVAAEGAIVEELVRDPGTVSPSVQLRILPGQRIEVISTHDQILGGPDDQVYLGCRFPADRRYRAAICDAGLAIARILAQQGVLGSFGMDFVVVPGRGIHLSEINLRLGGTTHPFLTARYITGAAYDADSGQLLVDGQPRVYTASDNLKSAAFAGLQPGEVIAELDRTGLAFDPVSACGVTLHLLGALPDYGKFGIVSIGKTQDDADRLFHRVEDLVAGLG